MYRAQEDERVVRREFLFYSIPGIFTFWTLPTPSQQHERRREMLIEALVFDKIDALPLPRTQDRERVERCVPVQTTTCSHVAWLPVSMPCAGSRGLTYLPTYLDRTPATDVVVPCTRVVRAFAASTGF